MANQPNNGNQTTNQDDRQAQISDYLQAPRRKRKNFVVLALGRNFQPEVRRTIEGFVKANYNQLAIVSPDNIDELKRLLGRNISLLVIHDELGSNRDDLLLMLKQLKDKRRNDKIPLLFMTKNPYDLIEKYHKYLLPHQEIDDYLEYDKASKQAIISKVKSSLDSEPKRASRRYTVSHPITFFHLTKNEVFSGTINDLSLHGAAIDAECRLRESEQLLIRIPVTEHLDEHEGDFLKISARVRRVFISGRQVGVSFQHVTEKQSEKLALLLRRITTQSMKSQTTRLKAQYEEQAKADI